MMNEGKRMYPTVYIADNSLESAKSLAAFLVGKGFPLENIVSSWVFEAGSEFGAPKSNARRAEIAASCLKDIDRASILVFTGNQKNYGKGGKNVELGYALGRGKTVIICGHYETQCTIA